MHKDHQGYEQRCNDWEYRDKSLSWKEARVLLWFLCCVTVVASLWGRKHPFFFGAEDCTRGLLHFNLLPVPSLLHHIVQLLTSVACADSNQDGYSIWLGPWWQPNDISPWKCGIFLYDDILIIIKGTSVVKFWLWVCIVHLKVCSVTNYLLLAQATALSMGDNFEYEMGAKVEKVSHL